MLDWISQRWQAARLASLQRQQMRALSDLNEDTLRDIGISEYLPRRPLGYTLEDFERGRW